MQSCSIHHCVLFFLTLTFTTAPVSAAVCSAAVKLHQSVILPCEYKCPGMAKWTLTNNRDVVLARCDQTSCSSVEGYEMSHDQYLKGDLSLTITAADYSKRNTYACECGISDFSIQRLSIETVFSAVQMNPGEDLILDLSVPEPVEVIYKSRDSADGEQICTVTQRSLQCKAEYTHRTSLSYPELILRDVQPSDSGSYTIRDLKNNEDIRVYDVTVTGLTKGGIAAIVLLMMLVVLLLAITGVIIYRRKAADQELKKVKIQMEETDELIKQVQPKDTEPEDQNSPNSNNTITDLEKEEKVKKVEKAINDLEQQYTENSKYSEFVGLFCNQKRAELKLCKTVYATKPNRELEPEPEQLMETVEDVVKNLEDFKCGISNQKRIPVLRFMYNRMKVCLKMIEKWSKKQREELIKFKQQHSGGAGADTMIHTMERLLGVYEQWCKDKMNELEEYGEKLDSAGSPKEDPTAVEHREGEELTPLNPAV
ncbi:uncharacterized protein LOC117595995 [Pangasianodon hypophthalmus]|uniref:uncharacterized protein LOC117595995 n=1 Tax=Pangasianodon hypophthalmus TaxID=310915 RepID=UPI002307CF18|nr:uncharacterized protein LOC117595995 [Pangasianodon hypophthalmus]XP_053084976.1 uncharacterized protein LOC117595995 [Pangasianodon hypophthalmus]XP_053084977.1 uncharacterized protein LOC117595995 [Pangasianodon hypophthalmus]